jgi:hypothetical protein
LHVTQGHPGTRSDKTIVKTDEFLQAMKSHAVLWDDVTFELYKSDGTITVVKGAYLISDNGYAKWRMLQAPIKSSSSMEELRWSTRLESLFTALCAWMGYNRKGMDQDTVKENMSTKVNERVR